MKIRLNYKPRNPIIIEGFPGFGLVSTIATEFLIKHLDAKKIGSIWSDEIQPIAAVHEGSPLDPIGIFYSRKKNIVIVHAITNVNGLEWKISDAILELSQILKAKELISLEGIGSTESLSRTFYYSTDDKNLKRFDKLGILPLREGIIIGVSGALMLKAKKLNSFFVETSVGLADSKAAAKIIEILNTYLKLGVDVKPLIKSAEKFEEKLRDVIQKSKEATQHKEKKDLDYFG
nr:proteasome assembly chaperone family protein [Candidatus Woesearchaeota archaeon]